MPILQSSSSDEDTKVKGNVYINVSFFFLVLDPHNNT